MQQLGLGQVLDNPIFDKPTEARISAKPNQIKSPIPKPRFKRVSQIPDQKMLKSKPSMKARMNVIEMSRTTKAGPPPNSVDQETSIIDVLSQISSKIDQLDTDMNKFKTAVMEKLDKMEGNIRNKGDLTEMEILVQETEISNKEKYKQIKDKVEKIENIMSGLAEAKEPIANSEQRNLGTFTAEIREQNQIQEKRLNLIIQNLPEKNNLNEDLDEINILISSALDLPIQAIDCI